MEAARLMETGLPTLANDGTILAVIERRLDKQDKVLDTIAKKVTETNGRLTTLETARVVREATEKLEREQAARDATRRAAEEKAVLEEKEKEEARIEQKRDNRSTLLRGGIVTAVASAAGSLAYLLTSGAHPPL